MKLRPLSPKSLSYLKGDMKGNPHVNVIERKGNKVLVTSKEGNYCAWVALKGDRNWEIVFAS